MHCVRRPSNALAAVKGIRVLSDKDKPRSVEAHDIDIEGRGVSGESMPTAPSTGKADQVGRGTGCGPVILTRR